MHRGTLNVHCPGETACPRKQNAQGETACPGGAACPGKHHSQGEQHALGEQHARGSSMFMGSIIKEIYCTDIACLRFHVLQMFCRAFLLYASPPGMELPGDAAPLPMLFPSGHTAAPWSCCPPCGRSLIKANLLQRRLLLQIII
jgi:hypothetical protein